ncbi:histidine phosphatase family protein [Streptomyces piniterrae]|uniref:Histidine phosphatase family protein n=1 Tax=Streptomyces piniterrae TaxID=2571125 RepID=A0A4U0P2B2_9ACTN|nr:histidine phosphatase family protein [Streptomyces piniterrae]TJZ56814.1 histidine phosphatase family protein [Streptomyces piniterrae]
MTGTATRYLYLIRHGEASPDESELTEAGRRQATLLGRRLRDIPFAAVRHGPLPRAEQTARLIDDQLQNAALQNVPRRNAPLQNVPLQVSEVAGDYVPYVPGRDELPAESADFYLRFLAGATDEERERGPALARKALDLFTGPVDGEEDRHELVVTHNFLVAWLVRDAMHAPKWRWLGLNYCNAALTVIRYAPGRPATVLLSNDMRHLPTELRWTGFPSELHI